MTNKAKIAEVVASKSSDEDASDAELEAAIAVVEATADQKAEKPAPKKKSAPKQKTDGKSFSEVLPGPDGKTVENMVHKMGDEVTAREDFETKKSSGNANIQRTLKKVRNQVVTKAAARVIIACNVDPNFINRVAHDGSRYNVYAIGKFADIVKALTGGVLNNSINIAVMKSMFQFRAAGVPFNMDMAKAAASDKIRISDPNIRKLLMSHTVSASTAPTQASSTMQALTTLGVVKAGGTNKRNPVYELTDHPVVAELKEVLAA